MAFDFNGNKQPPKPTNTARSNDGYSSSLNSVPRPSGSSSAGFKNAPSVRDNSYGTGNTPPQNLPVLNDRQRNTASPRRTQMRSRTAHQSFNPQIPWRIVLPIVAIMVVVILCIVFRDAITAFLSQVLTWIIIILVIIGIIKWLIFPRRRR